MLPVSTHSSSCGVLQLKLVDPLWYTHLLALMHRYRCGETGLPSFIWDLTEGYDFRWIGLGGMGRLDRAVGLFDERSRNGKVPY